MNPNITYYNTYASTEVNTLRSQRISLRKQMQKEYDDQILLVRKELKLKKKDKIPENEVRKLKKEIFEKYQIDSLNNQIKELEESRILTLFELAKNVVFSADPLFWNIVKRSHTSTYSTQPDSFNYAKASLLPLRDKLRTYGIQTKLKFHDWKMKISNQNHFNTGRFGTFKLTANCPRWMADAAEKLISLTEFSRSVYPSNLKVLLPFISHEQLDRHFRQVEIGER